MDPRRAAFLLALVFAGLLAFHLWLLQRIVVAGNLFVAVLLAVAISIFVWRIVHYAGRYRSIAAGLAPLPPTLEMRRIRQYMPILAGLIVLKVWLVDLMWSAGEIAFAVVLVGAVAIVAIRLILYARRWAQLRRAGPAESQESNLEVRVSEALRDPSDEQ